MRRLRIVLFLPLFAIAACSASELDTPDSTHSSAPSPSTPSPSPSPLPPSPDAGPDANGVCCPIDSVPMSCMKLGGHADSLDQCYGACDFWCSTDWTLVKDAYGCDEWTYQTRSPAPGENDNCLPEAGPPPPTVTCGGCALAPLCGQACSDPCGCCDCSVGETGSFNGVTLVCQYQCTDTDAGPVCGDSTCYGPASDGGHR